MGKIVLYHGSKEKIEKPLLGKGKVYNDYGQGFYCTYRTCQGMVL